MVDLVHLVYEVIRKQKELKITNHIYRTRTYSSKQHSGCSTIPIPDHITTEDDLSRLFDPILTFIKSQSDQLKKLDEVAVYCPYNPHSSIVSNVDATKQRMIQIGSKVKIHWTTEEVKGSGWKGGWYTAKVHGYDELSDTLTVTYSSEPSTPYEEELNELLNQEKIKLVWSPL